MTGYQSYTRTDIQTSDPRAVIVLLYEGAIRYLRQALEAQVRDERMRMSDYILKTQKIIQFLDSALDFEQGGDLAGNLNRLYCYMRDTLSQANIRCDGAKIQEVIDLFKPLLDAWREIAKDPAAAAALETRAAGAGSEPVQAPTAANPAPVPATAPAAPAVEESPEEAEGVAVAGAGTYGRRAFAPSASPKHDANGKTDVVIAGRAAYGLR
jgi:flagellar protein FliS